jgi:RHS repeat-associated protein
MGNKVEENIGGTTHEYVSAFGVDSQMTGQTLSTGTANLPGGVQAVYTAAGFSRFRFPDWQGSIRAESKPGDRTFSESLAFAPFGERYATKGAAFNVDSFTGKPDQLVSDEYDFAAREEHNGQGRWVSPDPMPGTGNKYVYADNNPLSNIDLYGLLTFEIEGQQIESNDAQAEDGENEMLAESHPPDSHQTPPQTTPTQGQTQSQTQNQTQTPQTQQQAQAAQAQKQSECSLSCKLKKLWHEMTESDAELTEEHRQWLINNAKDDAAKDRLRHAKADDVNSAYYCMQSASCVSQALAAAQAAAVVFKIPIPGLSGKEAAKDVPEWARGNKPTVNESGKDFATRLMDGKYGEGNWSDRVGPGKEFNQIQKWGDRAFQNPPE